MKDQRYPGVSIEELRQRLWEAEDTLHAIRDGDADALVIRTADADKVHALSGGDEGYRVIMEAMDTGAVAIDANHSVVFANAALCGLLNCTQEHLTTRGLLGALSPSVATLVGRLLNDCDNSHQGSQFEQVIDGQNRHFVVTAAPLPLGFGIGKVVTFTDVSARLAAERATESERIARAVISSANEAMVVCDTHGKVINANAAALGLLDSDPLGVCFDDAFRLEFPVTSQVMHADDLVLMAIDGSAVQGLEAQLLHGGRHVDLLISAAPLRLADNEIGGCVVTLVDNSERKGIEKQQSLLLLELNHRVKNTLAMVMSIASRTAANADDLVDFRSRFNSRLQAFAATHTLLAEASWGGLLLSAVIKRELAPFITSSGPKVVMSGLDLEVSPDIGITFGLVVHELTTNAVKYGALARQSGIITITGENKGDGLVEIVWTEAGGPPVAPPTRRGFGQTLVARSLNRGNGSSGEVTFKAEGVQCRMVLPLRA